MAKIHAPEKEFAGRIGDVVFVDGVAETDDHAVISYCRDLGYEVTEGKVTKKAPAKKAPAEPATDKAADTE